MPCKMAEMLAYTDVQSSPISAWTKPLASHSFISESGTPRNRTSLNQLRPMPGVGSLRRSGSGYQGVGSWSGSTTG